jgi:hypothetical protein
MSFCAQAISPADLARAALSELDADEPDLSPAQLLGGSLAWGESGVALVEAARDPSNAPTMRPHVIAPCQALQSHPALRLHCTCGRGLDFLALASLATGVLVVSSPRLLPKKRRWGGTQDLAAVDGYDPEAGWSLLPWEASMRDRGSHHKTAWENDPTHPVLGPSAGLIGDTAKRQTFNCTGCEASHTFRNITLLRLVLQAISDGERKVRLSVR